MNTESSICLTCHEALNQLTDSKETCCYNKNNNKSMCIPCKLFHQEFHSHFEKARHLAEAVNEISPKLKVNIVDCLAEVKNEIDLRRERLIDKINAISIQQIKCVDAYQDRLLSSIEKPLSHIKTITTNLSFNSVREISLGISCQINQLQTKLNEMDALNETLSNCSFTKSGLDFDESMFGYLNLNESNQHLICLSYKQEKINIYDLNTESIVNSLRGHSGGVSAICMLDKDKLISGGVDTKIKLWCLKTNECLLTLKGHSKNIKDLKLLHVNLLASASEDSTIKLWDLRVKSGNLITTLNGHSDCVKSIDRLPDGHLLSGSYDATFKIWSLNTGSCTATIFSKASVLRCLKVLSGQRFASCTDEKEIKIWSYRTGQYIAMLQGHKKPSFHLELIDANLLASCSEDKTIKLWNLSTYNCIQTFQGHTSIVFCVRQDKNGHLISTSKDKSIIVWDIRTAKVLKNIKINSLILKMRLS